MINYQIITDLLSGKEIIKKVNQDGTESWIPTDPANSDYQAYLKSLEDNKK